MLKSLLMAGALTMAFSGTAMADNSPAPAAGCTSCSAPIGTAGVPVKMAQISAPRVVGPAQQIDTPREGMPNNVINVCCPPLQNKPLGQFDRLPTPSGSGLDPYGIKFTRDPGLDGAMIGFAPFLSQFIPAGYEPNSVHLDAQLRHFNPVPFPPTSLPTSANFLSGTIVKQGSLRAWWLPVSGTLAPSGVWSGPLWPDPNASNPAYDWSHSFEDGYPGGSITPAHMQPNQWYMVKLSFKVAMKRVGDPKSWIVQELNCSNLKPRYFRIKFDYNPNVRSAGGNQVTVEEMK